MKLPRRQLLHLAAGAAALPAVSRFAWSQVYPSRPVRLIAPFAPAGSTDIIARLMGQWLSGRLGQQFVIDNRPGGGGNIGTEAVVRASPDGHTLLMVGSYNAVNATLYAKLNFDLMRDIAPVASVIRGAYVMVVNPSVPAKTVPEFIAYAKANPGKVTMASSGIGTPPLVAGELFKMMAEVNLVHVPYRGSGPALVDLLAGQVQVSFPSMTSSIGYIRAGTLRALAVTTAERSDALPDIPTVGEFVPGYEASAWYGIGAPRNTPVEVIDKLNKEINAGLADPKIKARLADLGNAPLALSPADFGKLSLRKPRSGPRWSSSQGLRRIDAAERSITFRTANPSSHDTIQHLEAYGVDLYLDQQAIDTTTPMGKLVFRVAGAFAEFERTMIPPTNQSRSQARRCSGREARPAEDRQRDRTKGAKAACERCGYLEGGKVSQHRDWHGPAHLKRARLKEATYFVLSPSFMRAPGRGNFSISNFHPRAPQIDVATVLIRMVHRALPAHQ